MSDPNRPFGRFHVVPDLVEIDSPQCGGGVCLVYEFEGDPRPECTENCPSASEIEDGIYCSCRCDGDADAGTRCACPSGFSCTALLEIGPPSIGRSYCTRD